MNEGPGRAGSSIVDYVSVNVSVLVRGQPRQVVGIFGLDEVEYVTAFREVVVANDGTRRSVFQITSSCPRTERSELVVLVSDAIDFSVDVVCAVVSDNTVPVDRVVLDQEI